MSERTKEDSTSKPEENTENNAEDSLESDPVESEEEAAEEVSCEVLLEKAQADLAELKDKLLRTVAEQENFKKRMERERLSSLKYAGEAIFREILPSVDNLERAISQGIVEGTDAEQNLKALVEGVEMTLKSLIGSLAKFEVKPVESVGQPFDPQHQEALVMEASDSVPADHVIREYEKGYFYKDRLLRAAKVIVSSGATEED